MILKKSGGKKKAILYPKYGHLNIKGQATQELLTCISKDKILLGLDTYRALKYMIEKLPTIPFPSPRAKPIFRGLETLEFYGYLKEKKAAKYIELITKDIEASIKRYQSKNHKKSFGVPDKNHPLHGQLLEAYRQAYPHKVRSETNFALNFIIYFIWHHIGRKRFTKGSNKLDIIIGFLKEQNVSVVENTDTVKKGYERSRKHIAVAYCSIFQDYPHGMGSYPQLHTWDDLIKKA